MTPGTPDIAELKRLANVHRHLFPFSKNETPDYAEIKGADGSLSALTHLPDLVLAALNFVPSAATGGHKNGSKIAPCLTCKTADCMAVYTYDNGWRHVECDKCHYLGPGEGSIKQAIASHNARREAALLASAEEAERLRAENERLVEENARLRVGLNSAVGYMMNAQIDLRTGAPKQTAINTINGGIDVLRAALGAPK